MSGAGDVDKDGRADIVLGAPAARSAAGYARVLSGKALGLAADAHLVSLARGGGPRFRLDGGTRNAGKWYVLVGSASGTTPGLRLAPNVTLPLNPDGYMAFLLAVPNTLVAGSIGRLDARGRAAAKFTIPAGVAPKLANILLWHAYAVFAPNLVGFDFASNARPLTLVK